MASEAVKLLREKRRSDREARLWSLLEKPEVLGPIMGVTGAVMIRQLGSSRVINRDFAGFLLAAWTAYCAANAGIKDKYALGAITAAATAAYAVSTPSREDEALVTVNPGNLLGGDGKLFWWDIPILPDNL